MRTTSQKFIGYARASTHDQNLDLQIDALLQTGCERSNIFVDKISGAKSERPGLTRCMESLQQDDVLIARIARLIKTDFSSIYNYIDKKILTKNQTEACNVV